MFLSFRFDLHKFFLTLSVINVIFQIDNLTKANSGKLKPFEGLNMYTIKDEVIHLVNSMPDDITVDDIIAELYFKLQVDAGLKELDEGKGIPHNIVKDRIAKWLKK
jgi:hypothetical protein